MTTWGVLPLGCLLHSPPVTTLSGRRVPVYPRSAPRLPRPAIAAPLTPGRVPCAFPNYGVRPCGSTFRFAPTIGSAPGTR